MSASVVKTAGSPHTAPVSPEVAAHNNALKAHALRMVARAGVGGLGAGALAAGLYHLLGRRPKLPEPEDEDTDLAYPAKTAATALRSRVRVVPKTNGRGWDFYLGDRFLNSISTWPAGAGPHQVISTGRMPEKLQGMGLGKKIYGEAIRRAPNQTLQSDAAVSPEARRVWEGMSRRRGYDFQRNEPQIGAPAYRASLPPMSAIPAAPAKTAGLADAVVDATMATKAGDPASTPLFSPRWWRGDSQTSAHSIPWAIPAGAAAGLGGMIGGHHLVRWLLQKRRKAKLDSEVAAAQKEYESAMSGMYDPRRVHKLASVAEEAEKRGFPDPRGLLNLDAVLGTAAGGYGLIAGGIGTATGLGAYRYFKGRSKAKMLVDALKQRAYMRALSNPQQIHIRPVQEDEEEDKKVS